MTVSDSDSGYIMLMVSVILYSSQSPHSISPPARPSSPWPVNIHTEIQPCGKSDKTSVELHRLGGMYVANDFQRLMTRKEVENCEEGRRRANEEGNEKEEEKKRGKKNLNQESMKHSWTFRQQRRLLIKAKYWSFSSLLSPPHWFSSLYCWPPEEKCSIIRWEVIEQVKDSRDSLCGQRMRVCTYMCIFLFEVIALCVFRPQCFSAVSSGVKNQIWVTLFWGPFSITYPETHCTHQHTPMNFLNFNSVTYSVCTQ